ncbi:hypothetical protein F511_18505 [Dorcoceras hygrometricum]|uniref:Uncharacterized protein n=1 Tax=Dorcoceras hygrometricum TaxID=472368 RepID=A0A2Z7AM33_9LAMI|nr:hypothetical protein F511_18505 [Dorcoceras hygrometricum]
MASSLLNNEIQIYFDSVYGMADEGMVQMFKALESSELRGFLGCSSAIYEDALMKFFQNASVRDNKFVGSVQGKEVEISEELFAGTFELLTEGLTVMTDVPKDLVFDARSAFSMSSEHIKTSCKKREMKFEFRLLNDTMAKTVAVKASSFDAVTHERFLMMYAIHGGVKVNWGRLFFKNMVTPASKQARGFAVQICNLLKGAQDLDLGAAHCPCNLWHRQSLPAFFELRTSHAEIEIGEPGSEEAVVLKAAGTEPVETKSRIDVSAFTNDDDALCSKVLSNEEGTLVEKECEKEKEKEKEIEPVADEGMRLEKITDSEDTET